MKFTANKSLLLFSTIASLALIACRKEKTSWDSDWVIPIFQDTLSLKNLENDSTIYINSSSLNYEVELTRTIANIGLSDIFELEDTTIIQDFHLASGSLPISPGYNIVNQIEEHNLNVEDLQLKKIRVKTGQIVVTVFNPVETIVNFDVTLPGVTKNGNVFNQAYSVPAHVGGVDGTAQATLDISGYWIDLTGENGNSFNKLQSQMNVQSDPNGPSITLSSSDLFKIKAQFIDLTMDYAKGYFGSRILSDTITTNIDFLNAYESGSIDLPATSIQFDLENGMKLSAKAELNLLENTNSLGSTVTMNSSNMNAPFYLNGATGNWEGITPTHQTISFTPSNSNLEQYLENLGSSYKIGYKVQLNPWGNTSGGYDEILPESRLKVKMKAELPLTLGTNDLVLKDTFELNLDQEENTAKILSGVFTLNYTNAFPLQGEVELLLLNESGQVMHTIDASNPIISSVFGEQGTDGLYRKKASLDIVIPSDVISSLKEVQNVLVRVKLNSPDYATSASEAVSIPGEAFLSLKMKAGFKLNVSL